MHASRPLSQFMSNSLPNSMSHAMSPFMSRFMFRPPAFLLTLGLIACAGSEPPATGEVRETLANGAVRVWHPALASKSRTHLTIDLEIGAMEGDANDIFGDIRSVEADSDGTIYILDTQASEVRAFGPDGVFRRMITTRGEGPGELTEANGMQLDPSGTLWVEDYGKWTMIGFNTQGVEVGRYPMAVRSYGYMWTGVLDARGRAWKTQSHPAGERVASEPGLNAARARVYWKSSDPDTDVMDSVFVGESTYHSFMAKMGSGTMHIRMPFTPQQVTTVHPTGGFWVSSSDTYRIVRLDGQGDTVLVIEAPIEAAPVTDEDRSGWVEETTSFNASALKAIEEAVALAPDTKPMLDQMFVDDENRLWVRRVGAFGDPTVYDVFGSEGEHRGTLQLSFTPFSYFPPRVRHGNFYTVVRDELDVPRVVRAPIPLLRTPRPSGLSLAGSD